MILENTGSVRRMDDLGRLAIPKDLRRHLRIDEGSSVEFHTMTYNGQPYLVLGSFTDVRFANAAAEQAKLLRELIGSKGIAIMVTDRERVVASEGSHPFGTAKGHLLGHDMQDILNDSKVRYHVHHFKARPEGAEDHYEYHIKNPVSFIQRPDLLEQHTNCYGIHKIMHNNICVGSVIAVSTMAEPEDIIDKAIAALGYAALMLSKAVSYA